MTTMQMRLLQVALDTNTPVYLSGEPGIGKTAVVEEEIQRRDGIMYLFQVSQRDPVDLTGAMHPVELEYNNGVVTVTRYSTPEWVHNLNQHAADGRFVAVFLDEATTAAPMSLNATLTLVQSRKAGEYSLHPGIRFVIAGNPPGTNSGVYDLPAAFANRIMHIQWTADVAAWSEFILEPGHIASTGDDQADTLAQSEVAPLVVQFVKNAGSLLAFPKHEADQGKAWPSPRSWEQAIRNLAMARAKGLRDYGTQLTLATSIVGEGMATEFMAFERDLDLPDPEEMLANPKSAKLPERQDQLFVMLAQVTAKVMKDFTAERNVAVWQILSRVAEERKATDIAATHARTLAERIWQEKDKSKLGDFGKYLVPFIPMLKEAGLYKGA